MRARELRRGRHLLRRRRRRALRPRRRARRWAPSGAATGPGGFAAAGRETLPADSWYGTDAGDVDGDGRDEVSFTGLSGGLQVWTWSSGDVWSPLSSGLPGSGPYQRTQLRDVDVDGNVDLVAAGRGGRSPSSSETVAATGSSRSRSTCRAGGSRWAEAFEGSAATWITTASPDFAVVQDEYTLFGGGTNELYVLLEASTPTEGTLSAGRSGSRGAVWAGGQVRFVEWASAAPAADPGTVSVDFSSTGASGPWRPLAADVPEHGRVQVLAPSGVSSSDCRLRYQADDGRREPNRGRTPVHARTVTPAVLPGGSRAPRR